MEISSFFPDYTLLIYNPFLHDNTKLESQYFSLTHIAYTCVCICIFFMYVYHVRHLLVVQNYTAFIGKALNYNNLCLILKH